MVQFSANWKQFECNINSITDNVTDTLQDRTCLSFWKGGCWGPKPFLCVSFLSLCAVIELDPLLVSD